MNRRVRILSPECIEMDSRRRDFLTWFHPFSLMNKMANAMAIIYNPGFMFASIGIGFIVGLLLQKYKNTLGLTGVILLILQLIFFLFITQPDEHTGGSSVLMGASNIFKIIGMWIGWYLSWYYL